MRMRTIVKPARKVAASTKRVATRRVVAEDEMMDMPAVEEEMPAEEEIPVEDEEALVEIDPAATELVFEAEDVAELIAEVTGEAVEVNVDENEVVFTVNDTDYAVQPDGDEEILEASRKVLKGKNTVVASKKVAPRASRPVRRLNK